MTMSTVPSLPVAHFDVPMLLVLKSFVKCLPCKSTQEGALDF